MPFDAGSIVGKVSLDTADFDAATAQVAGASDGLSMNLGGIFDSLMDKVGGGLGESMKGVGHAVTAAFSGDVMGAIRGVGEAMAGVWEMVGNSAERFDSMGEAAQKVGVDVKWLSQMSDYAKESSVGLDGLVAGFRVLEERAVAATSGDKGAAKGFEKIGISASDLAVMLDEPQRLFERVQEGISGMGTAAERTAAAKQLLGRQGLNLIPIIAAGAEGFEEFRRVHDALGAGVSDSDTKMGDAWDRLGSVFSLMMTGIQSAVARPVLGFLADHVSDVTDFVIAAAKATQFVFHELGVVFGWVGKQIQPLIDFLRPLLDLLGQMWDTVNNLGDSFGDWLGTKAAGAELGGEVEQGTGANGGVTYNVMVQHDAGESAAQFGERTHAAIRQAVHRQQDEWDGAMSQVMAERAVGGAGDF